MEMTTYQLSLTLLEGTTTHSSSSSRTFTILLRGDDKVSSNAALNRAGERVPVQGIRQAIEEQNATSPSIPPIISAPRAASIRAEEECLLARKRFNFPAQSGGMERFCRALRTSRGVSALG
jgi:hypothetical protein